MADEIDIIERAEAAAKAVHRTVFRPSEVSGAIYQIVAALKAARAENERLNRERRFTQLLMLGLHRQLSDEQRAEYDALALYQEFIIGGL